MATERDDRGRLNPHFSPVLERFQRAINTRMVQASGSPWNFNAVVSGTAVIMTSPLPATEFWGGRDKTEVETNERYFDRVAEVFTFPVAEMLMKIVGRGNFNGWTSDEILFWRRGREPNLSTNAIWRVVCEDREGALIEGRWDCRWWFRPFVPRVRLLAVRDPSLPRGYLVNVPRNTRTPREARRWMFDLKRGEEFDVEV